MRRWAHASLTRRIYGPPDDRKMGRLGVQMAVTAFLATRSSIVGIPDVVTSGGEEAVSPNTDRYRAMVCQGIANFANSGVNYRAPFSRKGKWAETSHISNNGRVGLSPFSMLRACRAGVVGSAPRLDIPNARQVVNSGCPDMENIPTPIDMGPRVGAGRPILAILVEIIASPFRELPKMVGGAHSSPPF